VTPTIESLHNDFSEREELLHLNNASASETSLLTREKLDRLISSALVATVIKPSAAFLLAFEQSDDYDGQHFLWFRNRLDKFIYVDRVIVAGPYRRLGLGRLLYADLFGRAERRGHTSIVCEVNSRPPNPNSDAFHDAQGFKEVGSAAIDGGVKTARYLLRCRP
jgi:predicted GNAT superfamily acetyltransferase